MITAAGCLDSRHSLNNNRLNDNTCISSFHICHVRASTRNLITTLMYYTQQSIGNCCTDIATLLIETLNTCTYILTVMM